MRSDIFLFTPFIGEVTKRRAAIALMILIVFPDASPISEKILRLFQHIHKECFPSEQMHHTFSIVSTSKSAFLLLSKEDPALHAHILKVFSHSSGVDVEVGLDTEVFQAASLGNYPLSGKTMLFRDRYLLLMLIIHHVFIVFVSSVVSCLIDMGTTDVTEKVDSGTEKLPTSEHLRPPPPALGSVAPSPSYVLLCPWLETGEHFHFIICHMCLSR